MKNKKLLYLYGMCLSLNAIAMQNECNQANASGLTSSSNVAPQQHVPVNLDRFMAMMLSMQNRINVDGAAIGELRDTIEKQNATIGAERAQHKIDIGELRDTIEKQNATIGAERVQHKIDIGRLDATIGELRAELAQQNTTIGELRTDLRAAERRFTEMNILLESWK